jgi:drug/metabolite transporter (DMT)-like permease
MMFRGASHEAIAQDIEPSQWIIYGFITLISPIGAAIHTVLAKPYVTGENKHGEKLDPVVLTMLYMAPCIILLLPLMPFVEMPQAGTLDARFWWSLGFLIVMVTMVAYLGWLWTLKHFDASMVSISTYMIPVFGLVYSWLWLNEPMGVATLTGAMGIMTGVLIASVGER